MQLKYITSFTLSIYSFISKMSKLIIAVSKLNSENNKAGMRLQY